MDIMACYTLLARTTAEATPRLSDLRTALDIRGIPRDLWDDYVNVILAIYDIRRNG